jgi:hypothetical protein
MEERDAELPPMQAGASVWTRADLDERAWLTELAAADVAELEAAARPIALRGEAALDELARATADAFALPTLGPRLVALRDELLHGRGFAVWRGLPVRRMSMLEAAVIFLGIGAHLGSARCQNAAGHVLGHVKDLGRSSADPATRIYQTRERQTFHTDSCDVVGLLSLRTARAGGDSLLVSAGAIWNELRRDRPDLLARLVRPMAHDRRGEVPEGMEPFFLLPVFSWFAGELTVFYQRQYIDSAQRFEAAPRLDPIDVEALDAFDALANDPRLAISMRLEPGDVQLVHNHVLLHDRTASRTSTSSISAGTCSGSGSRVRARGRSRPRSRRATDRWRSAIAAASSCPARGRTRRSSRDHRVAQVCVSRTPDLPSPAHAPLRLRPRAVRRRPLRVVDRGRAAVGRPPRHARVDRPERGHVRRAGGLAEHGRVERRPVHELRVPSGHAHRRRDGREVPSHLEPADG